ncbi:pyridoxamine 5'-phosphate oxidase family protein [Cylindrospermum sp. FACHB-282]|uniref:pyridoxamine 5'-phosphate oxidase family protein n=1 Tax=Cylindrospermum sp. FACHB-282 TaxID=2692794 RepID=UPI0016845C60|nr:pyridoxamine 5'-phosphate oxidase family protein [Cylindrospermum sp. FACHB-282]MBD2388431.1 pyridoxamine 5'-phosphate oxidase family protein [Cylindrospermum sp. FACHB-282]
MTISTDRNQQFQQLNRLIKDIDAGMLTTVDDDGSLHSRPMFTNNEIDSDCAIWLFTYASSHKVVEIEHCQQVNLSLSSSEQERYISISGSAQLVKDRNKLQQLWKPELQTWFPKGLEDPDIALLKVKINKADYWDSRTKFQPQTIS